MFRLYDMIVAEQQGTARNMGNLGGGRSSSLMQIGMAMAFSVHSNSMSKCIVLFVGRIHIRVSMHVFLISKQAIFLLCSFLHPEDSTNPKIQLWLLKEKLRY